MVVLREYKNSDLKDISYLLNQENIKDINLDGLIYVVLDNKELIGVGKAQIQEIKYFLKYLIIKKEKRNKGFGDALTRAILYKLENNNINKLYFKGNNEYLIKKGFKSEIEEILFIDIREFFNNHSNCSGECNGV